MEARKHRSIAEIREQELIERLMSNPHWRQRLIGLHGIDHEVRFRLSVPLSDLPGSTNGDVDILLAAPGQPHLATAIEVKRIKIGMSAMRTGRPNKLGAFNKGVKQANRLAEIGFSQVYLFVFVVVDAREQNAGKEICFDGMPQKLQFNVDSRFVTADLLRSVGLVHYEFVQTMEDEPLGAGTSHTHMVRLAEHRPQSVNVTRWVEQSFAVNARTSE